MTTTCTTCKLTFNDYRCPYCFGSTVCYDDDYLWKQDNETSISRGHYPKKDQRIDPLMIRAGIQLLKEAGFFKGNRENLPNFNTEEGMNELRKRYKKIKRTNKKEEREPAFEYQSRLPGFIRTKARFGIL